MRNTTLLPLAAALALTGCTGTLWNTEPTAVPTPAAELTPAEPVTPAQPAPGETAQQGSGAEPHQESQASKLPSLQASDGEAIVGAYSDYQVLDPEHRDVFSAATRGTKAQNLRPQSVAIQVVNGLNYKYLCTSEDGRTRYAVIIHRPLPHSGEPSSLVSVDELPAE